MSSPPACSRPGPEPRARGPGPGPRPRTPGPGHPSPAAPNNWPLSAGGEGGGGRQAAGRAAGRAGAGGAPPHPHQTQHQTLNINTVLRQRMQHIHIQNRVGKSWQAGSGESSNFTVIWFEYLALSLRPVLATIGPPSHPIRPSVLYVLLPRLSPRRSLSNLCLKVAWHCYSCCDPGRDDTGEERNGRPPPTPKAQSSQPPPPFPPLAPPGHLLGRS